MTNELVRVATECIANRGIKKHFYLTCFSMLLMDLTTPRRQAWKRVYGGGGNETHHAMAITLYRAVGYVLDEFGNE